MRKAKQLLVNLVVLGTLASCGRLSIINQSQYETYFYVRDGVTIEKFSDYSPNLKDTLGDANIYKIEGVKPGPSALILGGCHPNEPSGQLAATLLLENLEVEAGTIYIVTETFKSVYTNDSPEKSKDSYYNINTQNGTRKFKFGTQTDISKIHNSYPGKADGTTFEKTAYAVTQLIKQNDIAMTIDLRESTPNYFPINTIIAHEDAVAVASMAHMFVMFQGVKISVDQSPTSLLNLSHRALGDHTDTLAMQSLVSSVAKVKENGPEIESLILPGENISWNESDTTYAEPLSVTEGVARHIITINELLNAYNEELSYGDGGIFGRILNGKRLVEGMFTVHNIPSYDEIIENGVGYYLADQPEDYQ